jgi:hypothetical protein
LITNDKVYRCACKVSGQEHVFTTDTTGKYVLMVDPENADLLKTTGWHVAPVYRNSKKLHARATSRAPGIRKGALLHRLALKMKTEIAASEHSVAIYSTPDVPTFRVSHVPISRSSTAQQRPRRLSVYTIQSRQGG